MTKCLPLKHVYDILATLGSFKYPQKHKKALLGALEVIGRLARPDLVPTTTCWSNRVGQICFRPLRDLYDSPGPGVLGAPFPETRGIPDLPNLTWGVA